VPTSRELAGGSPAVIEALRRIYRDFPEMKKVLIDPDKRNQLDDILTELVGHRPATSVEEAVRIVMEAGYHVTSGPVETRPLRPSEPGTVYAPAPDSVRGSVTADSMMGRLLLVYSEALAGLTDEEAARLAKLSASSGYWKRCSDLRRFGLIEHMEDDSGAKIMRTGVAGVHRAVCRITPEGRSVAGGLE